MSTAVRVPAPPAGIPDPGLDGAPGAALLLPLVSEAGRLGARALLCPRRVPDLVLAPRGRLHRRIGTANG